MISLRADASSLEAKLQQVKLDSKGAPSKGPGQLPDQPEHRADKRPASANPCRHLSVGRGHSTALRCHNKELLEGRYARAGPAVMTYIAHAM
ncbi:hypothetical protein HaLaN_17074 [Haematococcus lacustris]|uniref:Uncharacterized protein n=1 Tax=Haematococcus lacustris TaxID=44745 RepID=A0A699ZMN7_HAELA|nr:hypothetical protein HaLaN_17074 [Haematococcus lacustris]